MTRLLFLVLLVSSMGSFTWAQTPTRKPLTDAGSQANLRHAHEKWLDEDVVYIITREERHAFLLLKSDAERERFIEQFWQARNLLEQIGRTHDAATQSEQNAYRAEHYRRIAFANQNFAVGNVAGWKTARGRFYITLGQPDQIQKTPTAERWFYRHAAEFGNNVEIEFTTESAPGEFRVLKNP